MKPDTVLTTPQNVLKLMSCRNGATLADLMAATGWQAHSIRGMISRTLRKGQGLDVRLERKPNGTRIYRVVR